MGKKALCLIFAFLLSIESFAAVVSDNDGSAFITKAEFDSLKNNFQAILDSYNTGIDSKIDAAISSYIAGVKAEKEEEKENIFDTYKTYTDQKIANIKWNKATNFNLNVATYSYGDSQKIYQETTWFLCCGRTYNKAGYQYLKGPTLSSTLEDRIEVGTGNNIIAWGQYAPSCQVRSDPVKIDTADADQWTWAPTGTWLYSDIMRQETKVSQGFSANWPYGYTEHQYGKYTEVLPSDLETLDLTKISIAPLSTTYEGTLPPPPSKGAENFVWKNVTATGDGNYGENIYACNSGRSSASGTLPTGYTRTNEAAITGWSIPGYGGEYYANLEARWFRIRKYNELSFDCINSKIGFICPMKCGLPITSAFNCKENDKVQIIAKDFPTDGYLVVYVAKSPSDTWDGKKSSWNTSEYRVTTGSEKQWTLDINENGEYYAFAVWLPDTASVIPKISIRRIISSD